MNGPPPDRGGERGPLGREEPPGPGRPGTSRQELEADGWYQVRGGWTRPAVPGTVVADLEAGG